ncbi:MAG: radical SAM protein [Nanoarchaeota archaeon]
MNRKVNICMRKNLFDNISNRIQLGNQCNSNCIICDLFGKKSQINKDFPKIQAEIDRFNPKNSIHISGGEPTIHPDFFKTLNYLKKNGFEKIILETNGRIFSDLGYCKKIINSVVKFIIPVFSCRYDIHDSITRTPNSLKQTLKGIKNLVQLGMDIRIELIITNLNITRLESDVAFLSALGIKELRLVYPLPKKGHEKYIPLVSTKVVTVIDNTIRFAKNNGIKVIIGEPLYNPSIPQHLELSPSNNLFRYESIKYKHNVVNVSIIIPTYNRKDHLKLTLLSLFNQKYEVKSFEVIVIDDGSNDGTKEMIMAMDPPYNLKYIFWPRSKEYIYGEFGNRAGPARNIAIYMADGEYLLFVDSDIITDPHFVSEHMKLHKKENNIVAIGIRYWLIEGTYSINKDMVLKNFNEIQKCPLLDDTREPYFSMYDDNLNKMPSGWDHFHTNNVSVLKKAVIDAGCFDSQFITWSTEDNELGYRLYKNGLKFVLNRKSIGYHLYHRPEFVDKMKFDEMSLYAKNIFYKKYLDKDIFNAFKIIFDSVGNNQLLIGNKCNNNCLVCSGLGKKCGEKSFEIIKKDIEQTSKDHKQILISGGEPTIHKNIYEILRLVKTKKLYATIATNGRVFSDKNLVLKYINYNIKDYIIYVYSHQHNVHDHITQRPGSFDQSCRGIINLLNNKSYVRILIPLVKQNYKVLIDIVSFYSKIGVKEFILYYPQQPQDPSHFLVEKANLLFLKKNVPNMDEVIDYVEQAILFGKEKGLRISANLYYFTKS